MVKADLSGTEEHDDLILIDDAETLEVATDGDERDHVEGFEEKDDDAESVASRDIYNVVSNTSRDSLGEKFEENCILMMLRLTNDFQSRLHYWLQIVNSFMIVSFSEFVSDDAELGQMIFTVALFLKYEKNLS